MFDFFAGLFDSDFMPHTYCLANDRGTIAANVIADSIIALAYFSIPFLLITFVRKRRDLPFTGIFWMFGAFIVACGTTHIMEIWTLWVPVYRVAAAIKVVTAMVSLATAAMMLPLLPKALALPSPKQLESAYQQIRERELRFRLLSLNVPVGIFERDTDGNTLFVNKRWCDLAGLNEEDAAGKGWLRALHPEDRERVQSTWREVVAMGEERTLEYRYLKPDGSISWVRGNAIAIRNESNQVTGILGTTLDITGSKRTQDKLRDREQLLYGLFEFAPDTMALVNEAGEIVRVNMQAEAMFGYAREELLGNPIEMLLPERFRERHLGHRGNYQADPHQRPMGAGLELDGRRKDGSEFPVDILLSPLQTQQRKMVIAVVRDITSRKQAEATIQASLAEKEVLLKEIHHRVKNNLQVVSSLLNLQASRIQDETIVELFRESQNRIITMAMVHEQLYRSKNFINLDAREYISDIVQDLLYSYIGATGRIETAVEVEPIACDVDKAIPCGLIINELVTNALKYAFPNQRPGKIAIQFTRNDDKMVRLLVRDDGVGLPADLNLFQAPSLGFQLVRTLTRQLHGTLEVANGNGTEIRILFPMSHGTTGREQP